MIRSCGGLGSSRSPIAATTRGVTLKPPFTIAAYATASCIGVTATPCPNEAFARSSSVQRRTAGSFAMPATSDARSTPVRDPMPNFVQVW